jgi:hypothetical protein
LNRLRQSPRVVSGADFLGFLFLETFNHGVNITRGVAATGRQRM